MKSKGENIQIRMRDKDSGEEGWVSLVDIQQGTVKAMLNALRGVKP